MDQLYAGQTVSVTELKRNYSAIVRESEGAAVAVLNHNRPEAYLVPAEAYEQLMERLEDMEDALLAYERRREPAVKVTLEDLRHGDI